MKITFGRRMETVDDWGCISEWYSIYRDGKPAGYWKKEAINIAELNPDYEGPLPVSTCYYPSSGNELYGYDGECPTPAAAVRRAEAHERRLAT